MIVKKLRRKAGRPRNEWRIRAWLKLSISLVLYRGIEATPRIKVFESEKILSRPSPVASLLYLVLLPIGGESEHLQYFLALDFPENDLRLKEKKNLDTRSIIDNFSSLVFFFLHPRFLDGIERGSLLYKVTNGRSD